MKIEVIKPSKMILDGVTAQPFRQEVMKLLDKNPKPDVILADLQNVTFMDSAGLGTLVSILKTVRVAGSQFYVCSLSEQVKVIFELTKMEKVFQIFKDPPDFEAKHQN